MADYRDISKEPLLLRVRAGGEVDKMVRAALSSEHPLDRYELAEIGGFDRSPWLLRQLDAWFDNIRVEVQRGDPDHHTTVHYIDVAPGTPESIGIDAPQSRPLAEEPTRPEVDPSKMKVVYRWPQAPPLPEVLPDERFDKPSWYDEMALMVEAGRHISLESPPSVGKDTAVQQLAAEKGMPLVIVGGDEGIRRKDLTGSAEMVSGTTFVDVSEYAAAAVNGWWVLIPEINAAEAGVILFLNTQLETPNIINIKGKAYPVHENFRVFVSYNYGLFGTKPLPPSFKSRFFPIKQSFFTEAGLRKRMSYYGLNDISDRDGSVVINFALQLWASHVEGKMRYQVCTRRLMDAIYLIKAAGYDVKKALTSALINTIDSPQENELATRLLNTVLSRFPEPEEYKVVPILGPRVEEE